VAKNKKGSFLIEVTFYLLLSLLLTHYLFQWLGALIINVRQISVHVNNISNSLFAHISFLKIINDAPRHRNLWLSHDPSRCCWKNSKGTVCLYYKNGLLIQKTHLNESGITTRLVLLNELCQGNFYYFSTDNSIERIEFLYQFDSSEKKFSMVAKTHYGMV
jgi:hypothetical protein